MTMKNATIRWLLMTVLIAVPLVAQKEVSREDVLRDEFWSMEYEQFVPDRFLMEGLDQKLNEPLQVDIYLAFWCDDSKTQVSRFIRIIDLLSVKSQITLRFFDVGGRKEKGQKYYVEALRIEKVPTFIFKRKDAEIGRIIENPTASLLEDFLTIIL